MSKLFSYFTMGLVVVTLYQLLAQPKMDVFLIAIAIGMFLVEIFTSQQLQLTNIELKNKYLVLQADGTVQRMIPVTALVKVREHEPVWTLQGKKQAWTILLSDGEQLEFTQSAFYPREVFSELRLTVQLNPITPKISSDIKVYL